MSNTELCYGCGKVIHGRASFVKFSPVQGFARTVPVCSGRSCNSASKPCEAKAILRMQHEGFCYGCGKTMSGTFDHMLCGSCRKDLRWGSMHRSREVATREEIILATKREIAAAVVAGEGGLFRDYAQPAWTGARTETRAGGWLLWCMGRALLAAVAEAYAEGLSDGTRLLAGLSAGLLRVDEISAVVGANETDVRLARNEATRYAPKVLLEAALKEIEMQDGEEEADPGGSS